MSLAGMSENAETYNKLYRFLTKYTAKLALPCRNAFRVDEEASSLHNCANVKQPWYNLPFFKWYTRYTKICKHYKILIKNCYKMFIATRYCLVLTFPVQYTYLVTAHIISSSNEALNLALVVTKLLLLLLLQLVYLDL